ncbi:MAG: pinensin family lanthipeptide [Cyclobacteriaceae bacterium]
MKKKLSLKELQIKSFVTALDSTGNIKSGVVITFDIVSICLVITGDSPYCPPGNEAPKKTQNCPTNVNCGGLSGRQSCVEDECMH